MNCFELCIFEKLNTTRREYTCRASLLWIALNYVSLKSWIQQGTQKARIFCCCELLWIMYLWKVEYNKPILANSWSVVVNCFELCIFEKLNTTFVSVRLVSSLLWIALNYVSLKSWIQRVAVAVLARACCELLWIMYLWKVEYNLSVQTTSSGWLWIALNYVSLKSWIQPKSAIIPAWRVVNCFELCIFEKLNTTLSQSSHNMR